MALSDRIYELRKSRGLSQEQLAEKLGVSRQAVSKWESAKAVPGSELLIEISEFFDVSLDELVKGETSYAESRDGRTRRILGAVICILGIVSLIIWGIVSIFIPKTSDQIGAASAITIDGNGIFLILCLAAAVSGAVLLLKNTSR